MNKIKIYLPLSLLIFSIVFGNDASKFHGVFVGIEDYPGSLHDLSDCNNDAIESRDALADYRGWDKNNTIILTDDESTESAITTAISSLPRTSEYTSFFLFSGHGDSQEIGGSDGLVTYSNGLVDRLTPSELKTAFGSNYNRYACYIDACGSGIFPRDINKGVITSAVKANELATTSGGGNNSLYSYYIIEGIKGEAANSTGTVTAEGLFNYARPHATSSSRHPQKSDNYSGDLVISAFHVNIDGPSTLIYNNLSRAETPHATGTWTADVVSPPGSCTYEWSQWSSPTQSWHILNGYTGNQLTKTITGTTKFKCTVTSNGVSVEDIKTVYLSIWGQSLANNEPSEIILGENSPNPFNPTTSIRFGLPKLQKVEINVYSIKGEKVKTLVSNMMAAGYHTIRWNATDETGAKVSSGVYIYQLRCGNEVFTRKMIFAK